MSDDSSILAQFGGMARLFPLPNLVLFPQAIQPLHIFEPRYRQMVTDSLAGDRLIALAILRPGWEADYAGRPDIYPVACLGHIAAEQSLKGGKYNLLVRGLSRIRLVEEVTTAKLYRSARVKLLTDGPNPGPAADRQLRRKMAQRAPRWFAGHPDALKEIRKLLASDRELAIIVDILAFALPLDMDQKRELLETLDVRQRARRLAEFMRAAVPPTPASPSARQFPPKFSAN
jgi:Lon protease-like protein